MATELKDRIKVGLDETRMLVLVVQVLLGFACRGAFEPGFDRLPMPAQWIKMLAFALLIVTLAVLIGVPAYHRLAARGESTAECEAILRRFMTFALAPFAIALGIDVGLAALAVVGMPAAIGFGLGAAAVALICWYVAGEVRAKSAPKQIRGSMNQKIEPTGLDDKIKQILTECRIVLPGTQAFLGFQLSAFLTEAFGKLPHLEQLLHLSALGLVALSGILLMTPPAYHRIGEKGEMTQHFLRVASRLLICAMLPLALGISLDFYVVLSKVTHAAGLSFGIAAAAFATFLWFWLVFPVLSRDRKGAVA